MCWNALECGGMRWNALECVGMCWNALECVGMCWNVLEGRRLQVCELLVDKHVVRDAPAGVELGQLVC